jgi:hypothetical protein
MIRHKTHLHHFVFPFVARHLGRNDPERPEIFTDDREIRSARSSHTQTPHRQCEFRAVSRSGRSVGSVGALRRSSKNTGRWTLAHTTHEPHDSATQALPGTYYPLPAGIMSLTMKKSKEEKKAQSKPVQSNKPPQLPGTVPIHTVLANDSSNSISAPSSG